MPRVFCSIPDAQPGLINGQEFVQHEPGVLVSVGEVSAENLEIFSRVGGYSIESDADAADALQAEADKAAAAAEILLDRAKAAKAAQEAKGAKTAPKAATAAKVPPTA